MYWFIYRVYNEQRWLFYDGDRNNLKYCLNADDALTRWKSHWDRVKSVKMKRPPNKTITIKLPLSDDEYDFIWSNDMVDWVNKKKMDTRMVTLLNQLFDEYLVDASWCFKKRDGKSEVWVKESYSWVHQTMRDIIEGMCRLEPLQVVIWTDKETKVKQTIPWDISQDIYGVEYWWSLNDKGEEQLWNNVRWARAKTTNLFGVYVPLVRDAMFPTSNFDWHTLQRRQRDVAMKRGKTTFILCSRWWGKSMWASSLVWTYFLKDLNLWFEKDRPFEIHYYWLSKAANTQAAWYIKKMMLSLIDNDKVIEWRSSSQTLTLTNWKEQRVIKFISQFEEGVGRWMRPALVVIDEAARMDEEVYKTVKGTVECPVICISTINYETKKNWFWDRYLDWLKQQREYKPTEQVIEEIWEKYWMDKVKTKEELMQMIEEDNIIQKMRNDFYAARPFVSLKYTIDDVDRYSQAEKDELIREALMIWEDYCLAEWYSEYLDDIALFNADWLMEDKIPEKFDHMVVCYDEADHRKEWDDRASVIVMWVANRKIYVIREEQLNEEDIYERYKSFNKIKDWAQKIALDNKVHIAADVTRAWAVYRELEAQMWYIDYPIKFTKNKTDYKREYPFFLTGKQYLANLAKDEYFIRWNIYFSHLLKEEKWLLEEIKNFRLNENGKLEGKNKRKDDAVCAMMMWIFLCHREWLSDELQKEEVFSSITAEERVIRYNATFTNAVNKEDKRFDEVMNQIYSNYW